MKPLIALLALVSVATAAEGYQHTMAVRELEKPTKVKVGDVVRVTRINVERTNSLTSPEVDVVLFNYKRHHGYELPFRITASEWSLLEHSRDCYIRRTKDGWEYLGSVLRRDSKGVYVYTP